MKTARILNFLAPKPGIVASLAMAILVGMGERMAARSSGSGARS